MNKPPPYEQAPPLVRVGSENKGGLVHNPAEGRKFLRFEVQNEVENPSETRFWKVKSVFWQVQTQNFSPAALTKCILVNLIIDFVSFAKVFH